MRHAWRFASRPRLRLSRQSPAADLVIIDCIEFNERFRYADLSNMAFLAMDFASRPADLGQTFAESISVGGDDAGRPLCPSTPLPPRCGQVEEWPRRKGIPGAERTKLLASACTAFGPAELEVPERKTGFGSDRWLARRGNQPWLTLATRAALSIRSDVVRKELAARPVCVQQPILRRHLFSEWTERTPNAFAVRALPRGRRVIVDATSATMPGRRSSREVELGKAMVFCCAKRAGIRTAGCPRACPK